MGLIRAVVASALSQLGDMWQDYIYCDSLSNEVLVKKGQRKSAAGAGIWADSNVITEGSKIAVNEGQTLIVVENGKIVDFTAEPGGYEFKSSAEPSAFMGSLDDGVKITFNQMKSRFAYGGRAANDQRAYFVNTKEITGNKFGFGDVPYRDSEFNLSISLSGYGMFSFHITNPLLFYTNIAGNVGDSYQRETIELQIKSELQNAILPALGNLAKKGIRYDELPGHAPELMLALRSELSDAWREKRGIEIAFLSLSNITPDEESIDKIRDLQESRVFSNDKSMLGARLGAAQANAMEAAAKNTSGAANGLFGMAMAASAGGVNANDLLKESVKDSVSEESWDCECGTTNTLNFCSNCGKARPKAKVCPKCSYQYPRSLNNAKFCPNCGQPS